MVAFAELTWSPSNRQLRQFGLTGGLACPLLSWWLVGLNGVPLLAAAGVGLGIALVAVTRPTALLWPFRVLTLATYPLGLLVGEMLLLAVYLAVLTPIALLMRLLGRDVLGLYQPPADAASYWQPVSAPRSARDYYRQS